MSSSLAIAAVTETLRKLLDDGINADPTVDPSSDAGLAGTTITTAPPDKARDTVSGLQVNLFLYQTSVNAAWRNKDMPRQVRPGELGRPPLPLNLYYLVTAYGREDDEVSAHRLLGRAMSLLYDNAFLDRALIQAALPDNDLYQQIESIKVTPQPMSLEEISKLWVIFQTQYRISAAYEASVVLIDSNLPARTPLPVLRQGADDRGPIAFAETWPALESLYGLWQLPIQPPPAAGALTRAIRPAGDAPIARLGETLVLRGSNLHAENTIVRFEHPLLSSPLEMPAQPGQRPQDLIVSLPRPDLAAAPGVLAAWPCGFYQVSLVSLINGVTAVSNQVPLLLTPLTSINPLSQPAGPFDLAVTCRPRIRPEQERRVMLLMGSQRFSPVLIDTPANLDLPTTLTFALNPAPGQPATYTLRLRVDGVDSLPFAMDAQSGVLTFDTNQQLALT